MLPVNFPKTENPPVAGLQLSKISSIKVNTFLGFKLGFGWKRFFQDAGFYICFSGF